MKPGKIAQNIDDELKRERRRKARALKFRKIVEEYKKKKEGKKNGKNKSFKGL